MPAGDRAIDAASVGLAPIDRDNWRAAIAVRVTDEQLPFVAGHQPVALVILAKSYVRPGGLEWEPLALVKQGRVVGVLALAHGPTSSELLHLAVDVPEQRRGLGRAAMSLVVTHLVQTRPASRSLRLTVHPDNEPANRLYRDSGFLPTGDERDNEPVWSIDLTGR